jgi:hypothetical protein
MSRRLGWTSEVEHLILSYIRSGGYPWVAAECAGIPRAMFRQWMRWGVKSGRRSRYRMFYEKVLQARAQARLSAEVETRKNDARYWLTHGPGRETQGSPGWTNPASGRIPPKRERGGRVLSKEFLEMLRPILEALVPYPEAREAVARQLEKLDQIKPRQTRSRRPRAVKSKDGIEQ